ncbi:hypothetical protein TGVEG_225980 [Toxoplasma gondii VEG]|uniref:Uncharacterized protein n=2 Tax=Toxoplasma gondii (strain ATCC 50861 / VEG) TaxID=432359 RepID=V4ZB28_TOXGV|nr:hypothetical protein TGVEG_225980 [Toxoplasma gondii VEG]
MRSVDSLCGMQIRSQYPPRWGHRRRCSLFLVSSSRSPSFSSSFSCSSSSLFSSSSSSSSPSPSTIALAQRASSAPWGGRTFLQFLLSPVSPRSPSPLLGCSRRPPLPSAFSLSLRASFAAAPPRRRSVARACREEQARAGSPRATETSEPRRRESTKRGDIREGDRGWSSAQRICGGAEASRWRMQTEAPGREAPLFQGVEEAAEFLRSENKEKKKKGEDVGARREKSLVFDLERRYTPHEKHRVRAQMREALDLDLEASEHARCSSAPEQSGENRRDMEYTQSGAEREMKSRLDLYLAQLMQTPNRLHAPSRSGTSSNLSFSSPEVHGDLCVSSSSSSLPSYSSSPAGSFPASSVPPPFAGSARLQCLALPEFLRLATFLSRQRDLLEHASPASLAFVEGHPLVHLFARSLHRLKFALSPRVLASCVDFLLALSSSRSRPLLQSLVDLLLAPPAFASLLEEPQQVEASLALLLRLCRHPARLLDGVSGESAQRLWEGVFVFLLSPRATRIEEAELLALLHALTLVAEPTVSNRDSENALASRSQTENNALWSVDLDTALLACALERLLPDWVSSASPHALTALLLLLTRLGCLNAQVFAEIAEALLLAVPFLSDAALLPLLHTLLVCRQRFDLSQNMQRLEHSALPRGAGLLLGEKEDVFSRGEALDLASGHPLYETRAKRLLQALRHRVQSRFGRVPFEVSVAELGALFSVYKPNADLKREFLARCAASPEALKRLSPELFLTAARVLARLGVSHGSQARFAFAQALPHQLPRMQLHQFLELTRPGAGGGVGALETLRAALAAEKKARLAVLQVYRRLAFDACRAVLVVEGRTAESEEKGISLAGEQLMLAPGARLLLLGGNDASRIADSSPDLFLETSSQSVAQSALRSSLDSSLQSSFRNSSEASSESSASSASVERPRLPSPASLLSLMRGWMTLGLSRKAETPLPLVLCLLALESVERRVLFRQVMRRSLASASVESPALSSAGSSLGSPHSASPADPLLSPSPSSPLSPSLFSASFSPSPRVSAEVDARSSLGSAPGSRTAAFARQTSASLFRQLSLPQLVLLVSACRQTGLLVSPALAAAVLHRLRRSTGLLCPADAAEISFVLASQQLLRRQPQEAARLRALQEPSEKNASPGESLGDSRREGDARDKRERAEMGDARDRGYVEHEGRGEAARQGKEFCMTEALSVLADSRSEACESWVDRNDEEEEEEEEEKEEEERPSVYQMLFESICAGLWEERVEQPNTEDLVKIFWALVAGERWNWVRKLGTPIVEFCASHFADLQASPESQRRFFQALAHLRTKDPVLAREFFQLLHRTPVVSPASESSSSASLSAFFSPFSSPLPLASRSVSAQGADEDEGGASALVSSRNHREICFSEQAAASPEKRWWLARSPQVVDACAEFDLARRQLHTEEGILNTALRGSVLAELQLTWRAGDKRTAPSTVEEDLGALLGRLAAASFFQKTLDISPHCPSDASAARTVLRRSSESLVRPLRPFSSLALAAALPSGGFLPNVPEEEEYSLSWGNPVWRVGILLLPRASSSGSSTCRSSLWVLLEERARSREVGHSGGAARKKERERGREAATTEAENEVLEGLIRREMQTSFPDFRAGSPETPEGPRLSAAVAMKIKFLQEVRDWRVVVLLQEQVKERLKRDNGKWIQERLAQCRGLFPLSPPLSSFLRAYASTSALFSASSDLSASSSSVGTTFSGQPQDALLGCSETLFPAAFSPATDLPESSASSPSLAASEGESEDAFLVSAACVSGEESHPRQGGRKRQVQLLWEKPGEESREKKTRAEDQRLKQVSHYRAVREAAFMQLQRELHFLFSLD